VEEPNDNSGNDNPQGPKPTSSDVDKDSDDIPAASGDAVERAEDLVGTPYKWGGTNPNEGLDSSGFINAVFSEKGLSRTHAEMWADDGTEVSEPQPGDVVFFENTYKGGVSHSGVYIGNDQMIHSPGTGESVEVTTPESWEYHWKDKYIG